MEESIEERRLVEEGEEQNKKAVEYLRGLDQEMIALAQNKMLARKLLNYQAEQVHDLASRGLITDTVASELEHELHQSARGLLRLKMSQASSLLAAPVDLVSGLATPAVGMAHLVAQSSPLTRF